MKTSKTFMLAAALVLVSGLGASVMAQRSVKVNAIEISDGTVGYDIQTKKETAFGYSFLGRTSGSFPGSLSLSMNCTPSTPIPGDTSELTGGSWMLPVYMTGIKGNTGYAGSLYGTIANGKMNWDKTGTNADIYFTLNIDGGTQTWDGANGYATFVGTLFVDEKTQKTTLSGVMVFSFGRTIWEDR